MHHRSAVAITVGCIVMLVALSSLQFVSARTHGQWTPDAICSSLDDLAFNGTRANESVQWQVSLGPRLPGSNASAMLRDTITSTLLSAGWHVEEQSHERHGMVLTNLFARWNGSDADGGQVVMSAHYDSRNIADQDNNVSNRSLPVPGANDAASGTAVLIELARWIPSMNLSHDVVLFWNDAEDQNDNYTVGAEAWASNLSENDINNTHAFVLLDMVGDADLQLKNINPGNETLKQRIVTLGGALGLVNGTEACDGSMGLDVMQYHVEVGVLDDHIHAHRLNIPSIDIMDPEYGDAKFGTFGTHWHTMEDTPDKVSATSLSQVGRLVEAGLITGAFVLEGEYTSTIDNDPTNTTNNSNNEAEPLGGNVALASLAFVSLLTVLALLVIAEWKRH